MRNYSPKIDLVFRKLFGSEENTDLLLSLLNGIINCQPPLTSLTIKNPYNLASYVGSKTSILDIKAIDADGVWYDIELQICEYHFYGKCALDYLSKMYVDQLEEGMGYSALNKTIGIHLIDFNYFDDPRYRRHFVFKDMETNEHVEHLSYQQLYFIEMNKFRKDYSEVSTLLDRWITFLNKASQWDANQMPSTMHDDPTLVKAVKKLECISLNNAEREIYEAELKARLDEKEILRTREVKLLIAEATGLENGLAKGLAKGMEQGLEQGLAQGLEQGLTQGLAQGKEQGLEQGLRLTASNLLRKGLPIEMIAEITGWSEEKIDKLRLEI